MTYMHVVKVQRTGPEEGKIPPNTTGITEEVIELTFVGIGVNITMALTIESFQELRAVMKGY